MAFTLLVVILIERLFFYLLMKRVLDLLVLFLENSNNDWQELEEEGGVKTIKGFSNE